MLNSLKKSVRSNRKLTLFLIRNYGFLETQMNQLIGTFPPFLRYLFYKFLFRQFGKGVYIGENCYFRYPWRIRIGDNVSIGSGCQFYPSSHAEQSTISLNDNSILAPNVIIYGAGHPVRNPQSGDVWGAVTISENAYIGASSVIRYGVTVGKNSTVGMGSVVVKSLPDEGIFGGNPAKQLWVD